MVAVVPVVSGQVVGDKLRIDHVLAVGGMGVVVAATHLGLDQRVVVKFRRAGKQGDARRFLAEASFASRLRGPHVCRVMDLGYLDEATPYLVMEHLDGNDLALEVERRGPLPIEDAVEYTLQVCDALTEAHALGIVHRDIKPENLFLTRKHDGTPLVKVLDFGISKQLGAPVTTERELMGTPSYMAPEQWASAKHVTVAADIYALGATLHFLLAGAPPFAADSIPELFATIATARPTPLRTRRPDIPAELEALVLQCLARKPSERPVDVLDVADALLPFAPARRRAALSLVGRATRPRRSSQRRWTWLGAALAAGAIASMLIVLSAGGDDATAAAPAAVADPDRAVAPAAASPVATTAPPNVEPPRPAPEAPRAATRPPARPRAAPAVRTPEGAPIDAGVSAPPVDARCALDDVDCQLAGPR